LKHRRIDFSAADADRWRALTRMAAGPVAPTERTGEWFKITNAEGDDDDESSAVIDIYGDIGTWGVNATDFVAALRAITADSIDLHINSGGGSIYEALAIYNALIDHPANVVVHVDGIAASAASFISQAGDRVVMGRNAELMIHDGIGMTYGNAALHLEMAELLNKASDNIASIYAGRAGRVSATVWRQRMKSETWYSAQEAVDAGLADEALKTERRSGQGPKASLDLSRFNYAGRAKAPAPPVDDAAIVATASPTHHTDTADGTWDSGTHVGRLPSPLTVTAAKAMYGWYDGGQVDDGELPKSACKLPHHEVSEDGTPGAANLAGVRNALARLPQSDIPEGEHEAVRKHLQAHLDDAKGDDEEDEDSEPGNELDTSAAGWERLLQHLHESGTWDRLRDELVASLNEAVAEDAGGEDEPDPEPEPAEAVTEDEPPAPPPPPPPPPPDPEPAAAEAEPLTVGASWRDQIAHLMSSNEGAWSDAVSHLTNSRPAGTAPQQEEAPCRP
jgi:ATP-dependent protease ClpP protease subunit